MSTTTQSIDVHVPVDVAYAQWAQLESFPQFMHAVKRVDHVDDDFYRFVVQIAGHRMEYDAEVTERIDGRRIAWRARHGRETGGVVTFHRLDRSHTRVTLQLGYDPEGVLETVADLVNIVGLQAKNDLRRFKEFIESRQAHPV